MKCGLLKRGVTLYADDRICPECYRKNEIALKAIRDAHQVADNPSTAAAPSKIPTPKQAPRTRLATAAAARNNATAKSPLVSSNSAGAASVVMTPPRPPSPSPPADKSTATGAQPAGSGKTSIVTAPNPEMSRKIDEMASYITKLESEIGKLRDTVSVQASTISQLSQQVTKMKETIDAIQINSHNAVVRVSDVAQAAVHDDNVQTEPVDDNKSLQQQTTAEIVHRTLIDAERRRKNVVVSGLNEDSDDRSAFLQICESHFSVKPAISEHDCKRLGSRRDNKPRLLLVRLRSENIASTILHEAKRLRNSQDAQHIFINPDLSREAAKAASEARQRARRNKRAVNANINANANGDPVTINNSSQ